MMKPRGIRRSASTSATSVQTDQNNNNNHGGGDVSNALLETISISLVDASPHEVLKNVVSLSPASMEMVAASMTAESLRSTGGDRKLVLGPF
ncbi:hypothetical protein BC936DRAFT_145190 [Jimgerdemannia flammicorona]|uniref:Uncharacterized protein n=1 Tax=Jimgerdemannia flammicorona TaxID=994334 RepID=A0A433DAP5_9FUNG|nr:hypothetical protein BC936DRAFT_145190 [Jimgerdemannia flammicorona]